MDATESVFIQAVELIQTDGVGTVGLKCNACSRQAEFLEGNLKIFLEVWYNKECQCNKGHLTMLVANESEDDI